MKVDLQNFRYQRLKNIKMDEFLEDDLLLLLLFKKKSPSQSFKTYQTYVLGEKYLHKA